MDTDIKILLGQTDIYLIDQIMKGHYQLKDHVLDAGCGSGRNLHWFLQHNYNIQGIDVNEDAIEELQARFPEQAANFIVAGLERTPFNDVSFDHIICSAVLHFASNTNHFNTMLAELVRILKPGGSLFIRMTSDIGIEDLVELTGDGVYSIPDGSTRFLLTRAILATCMQQYNLSYLEPFKTVNVDDMRCMSTLLLQKNY